jgi:hypothetical protein
MQVFLKFLLGSPSLPPTPSNSAILSTGRLRPYSCTAVFSYQPRPATSNNKDVHAGVSAIADANAAAAAALGVGALSIASCVAVWTPPRPSAAAAAAAAATSPPSTPPQRPGQPLWGAPPSPSAAAAGGGGSGSPAGFLSPRTPVASRLQSLPIRPSSYHTTSSTHM